MSGHDDFAATWDPARGGEDMQACEVCDTMVAVSDLKGVPSGPAGTLAGVGSPTVVDACGDCRS